MRLLAGLCLSAASVVAAPQKPDLPPGVIGRLGTASSPTKGEPRPGDVTALVYLSDNSLFVGTLGGWTTWDLQKKQQRQPRPVGGPVFTAARDSERLFIGSGRKLHSVEPMESSMAEPARSWDSTADGVSVVAAASNGRRAVFTAGDRKLSVLEPKSGNTTGTVELSGQPIAAVLNNNGRILAVITREGAARVYTLMANGTVELQWVKRVARSDRSAIQFSPDGRLVAITTAGRVAILESATGRQLLAVERKFGEGDIRAIAFSRDGQQIATASAGPEPVVRVWGVETGSELATFSGHAGDINAVVFAPDGKSLASAGTDQVVLLWTAPPSPTGGKTMTVPDAWESLDALDAAAAYRAMGALIENPNAATKAIGKGFSGHAAEQARIKRLVAELAHDEFRTREAARRSLIKAGLRAAAVLTDPARRKLDAEGEERVKVILEALDSQGLHVPESGLYGEPLRSIRGVRILESIGGPEARAILEEARRGSPDAPLTKEAKAALETMAPK